MKKITFAIALLTFAAQAQNFPSPYCDIADTSIEEITLVNFANTSIINADDTSILIDKTAVVIEVNQGQAYSLTVEGFTAGNFDNSVVAFIDWNQNDILDDTGEVYPLGIITNSTGTDGVSVTLDITVPTDAVIGNTRIRITKTYTDDYTTAVINPCAIEMDIPGYGIVEGFGQALDFTLNTAVLGVEEFEISALSLYPIPANNVLHVNYKSILNAVKVYNLLGQEVLTQNTASSKVEVDVSALSAGAYIVKLFSEEGFHNVRIIKE